MKQTLTKETQRILNIMELDVKYMDQLLDKLSNGGMESLSDYEKDALQKMSTDDDNVSAPEIHSLDQTKEMLRFSPKDIESGQPLVTPEDNGETYGEAKFKDAFIFGEAEQLAGLAHPVFIDGDLSQLDKPEDEQQIRMLLPQGEYECVARTTDMDGNPLGTYLLMLKVEEDVDDVDDDFELGEMDDYNINNIGEPSEDLRNYEMGENKINEQLDILIDDDIKDNLINKLQVAIDAQEWDLIRDVIRNLIGRDDQEDGKWGENMRGHRSWRATEDPQNHEIDEDEDIGAMDSYKAFE